MIYSMYSPKDGEYLRGFQNMECNWGVYCPMYKYIYIYYSNMEENLQYMVHILVQAVCYELIP